jgi:hypothetical protein
MPHLGLSASQSDEVGDSSIETDHVRLSASQSDEVGDSSIETDHVLISERIASLAGASLFVRRERVDEVLVVPRHRRGRNQRALPVSLRNELGRPHIGDPDLNRAQTLSAKPRSV